ncbi:unnamed protein product [Anisakis simplex]|uniref:Kynureninase (inferred by orthology to a C. elegans protein) n=1 Tax=Anisakis simplex TaxID=6269 RepID=A0A0M3KI84_ANISI|nr:unnamed protein product [Anisakis simplex]
MTPSDPNQRGCQLSLKFNVDITKIWTELTKRGVVVRFSLRLSFFSVDKRYPDVIRVAAVHLYNSFSDVHRFVDALLSSINSVEGFLSD